MSATDKEQHTDTEKPTDSTESCRNEKERPPRARSIHTVDAHDHGRTVNLSSTMSSDNACSSDVASSSDHTPATIESLHMSPAYDYFQSMSRLFAGSMDVFQDDYVPSDSSASRVGMPFVGTTESRRHRFSNGANVEPSLLQMPAYNSDQLSPSSDNNQQSLCSCGDVTNRCVDCPGRQQQQPEQHVKDDALMRSDSFDTSAASIGSVATIPDSMVYDLSDEAADVMSSDELAESHCASVGDHRSVYSPTALSFDDGGAASDYYSSDPESANAVAAASAATAFINSSATTATRPERRRYLHSKCGEPRRQRQENISTSFDDHEFLHPPQVYPNDDETEREISLFLEKTYCLGAESSSNNEQQSDTYLSSKLSYHTAAASSSTSGHFAEPTAAPSFFEREDLSYQNPSNQTCSSRSSSAQNHHWSKARFSTPPPLERSSEAMTLPAPNPAGATATINSNHLGFPQCSHHSMTLKGGHGVMEAGETPVPATSASTNSSTREIDLKFRLMQSYTIWYLPKVTRQKAIEYLHNRQPGNFIVRHSSRPGTMALSLRSTNNSEEENLVEHFLIINTPSGLQINEAEQSFVDIVSLLQHYHQMNDGLPCKLRLPKSIERANFTELTHFWFTGERFWHNSINSESEFDGSAAGGSNSDDVASDPATDPATLGRTTIRTASCEDELEDPFGSCSSVCLDPPKIPPKTDEIRLLIKQDMESKILSSSSHCSNTTPSTTVAPVSTASNFETLDKLREYAPPDMLDGGGGLGLSNSSSINPTNNSATLHQFNPAYRERKTSSDKHHSINATHMTSPFVGTLNLPTLESELQSPKATPSDSGYDTSSRNVFERKLLQSNQETTASQKRLNNNLAWMYAESCSKSYPSNDMKDQSQREHTAGFAHTSPISSSNPFTFPESNEEESLSKMWSNSSGPFIDYPQCSRHQGASAKMNSNANRISAGAFSDDTSILSSDSMILSSNNPFKNLISPPAGVNRGHKISSELLRATGTNHQPKYNSSENFSANHTVTTTATPITASSCESIRSVNQSERSSSSSILASTKVLSGLYDRGRSKFCDTPARGAMTPNSFGNWFLGTSDLKSAPAVTTDAPTLPRKKNPNTSRLDNNDNSPPESQEDHPLTQSSAAYLLENVNAAHSPVFNARGNRIQKRHPYIPASWKVPRIWAYLRRRGKNSSTKIRDCIMSLANDPNSNFSRLIKNIVDKYANESDQSILLNQVRSEMNTLKIYLQSPKEKCLSELIDRERAKLRDTEFLNMDVITEDALYRTVLKQLYVTIMTSLIEHHRSNGNLDKMQTNLRIARSKSFRQLGIPSRLTPPKGDHLLTVKFYFKKMCCTYSPTAKMECLLAASKTIYNSVEVGGTLKASTSMGAEEFLPMLIYCLAQYNFHTVEVETQYIWAFLPPHMQTREPGYYLTALSSAAYILKNMPPHASWTPTSPMLEANASEFQRKELSLSDSGTCRRSTDCNASENAQGGNVGSHQLPSISDIQGFLKIVVPDEKMESIISKTLPVPPGMSATDVCIMLAHKLKTSHHPDVYGLYVVVDGKEDRVKDEECPQQVKAKLIAENKRYLFAYKRLKAHIIWPNTANNSPPSTLNVAASPTPVTGTGTESLSPTAKSPTNTSDVMQNISPKTPSVQSNFVELPRLQKSSNSFTARSISKLGAFGNSSNSCNATRAGRTGHTSPLPRYAVDNTYVPSTCSPSSPTPPGLIEK